MIELLNECRLFWRLIITGYFKALNSILIFHLCKYFHYQLLTIKRMARTSHFLKNFTHTLVLMSRILCFCDNYRHWAFDFCFDFLSYLRKIEHIYESLECFNQSYAWLFIKLILIKHNNKLYFPGSLENFPQKVSHSENPYIVAILLITAYINQT